MKDQVKSIVQQDHIIVANFGKQARIEIPKTGPLWGEVSPRAAVMVDKFVVNR